MGPDVSIIMCVYNEKLDLLKSATYSVLGQSYGNFEFIIVDDSDNEEIIDYLKSLKNKDNRVLYITNNKRLGLVRSLNKGLALAKGDYIARVDSDDIQREDRFKLQVAFLETNKNIGIVGSWLDKFGEGGEKQGVRHYPSNPRSVNKMMMIRNAVAHPTVMMKSQVIESIGSYNEEFCKAEDYELWMRAIKKGIKIANLEEPLVGYRISNTTKRDVINWRNNLKVKLQYFGFDYLGYRIIGVLIVSLMLILPSFLKRFVYSIYNRIA